MVYHNRVDHDVTCLADVKGFKVSRIDTAKAHELATRAGAWKGC